MNYITLLLKGKEFRLKIDTRNSIALEKRIGTNPMNILMEAQDGKIPSFEALLLIFHAALQKYQHGISMERVYDIYDAYVEDGHDMTDFMTLIMEVLSVSGYINMHKNEPVEVQPVKVEEVKPEPVKIEEPKKEDNLW